MKTIKIGDKLYTGKIVESQSFADTYNNLSADIAAKEKIRMDVEALKNGRHNMFVAYAMA